MNKEIKAKWLEALRSGKYKQGRKKLRSVDDEFCCLGVLCDIVNPEGWVQENAELALFVSCYTHGGMRGYPSREVLEAAQFAGPEQDPLVQMNDSEGRSFAEIADYIEKNF